MKMRLFGELGCRNYEVCRIRSCTRLTAYNSDYEFTLIGEGEKERYMHVDQAQLERLMSDIGVQTPEEFVGCEVVSNVTFSTIRNVAFLPKGAHVELMVLNENGKELEVQFRQY